MHHSLNVINSSIAAHRREEEGESRGGATEEEASQERAISSDLAETLEETLTLTVRDNAPLRLSPAQATSCFCHRFSKFCFSKVLRTWPRELA